MDEEENDEQLTLDSMMQIMKLIEVNKDNSLDKLVEEAQKEDIEE